MAAARDTRDRETTPAEVEGANSAALPDDLAPGDYTTSAGRRVRVVALDCEDAIDDSPSLLARAHRHAEEPTWAPASPSPASSGRQIPAGMAAGMLAGIAMLGMLAGVLSLPRPDGLQSAALVRPAAEPSLLADEEQRTEPAAAAEAPSVADDDATEALEGATEVASLR